METESTPLVELQRAAQAWKEPFKIDGQPFMIIPKGSEMLDLSAFLERPTNIREVAAFRDRESFVRYFLEFRQDSSKIFAYRESNRVKAILDDHSRNLPAKQEHVALLNYDLSHQWITWDNADGASINQKEFAEFLEDNILDIANPDGADMIAIARSLAATTSVEFKSALKLENGNNELRYSKTTTARAGEKDTIEIPEKIELSLPVFEGGEYKSIAARFNYRIHEGGLVLSYRIIGKQRTLLEAFSTELEVIEELTEFKPFC